MKKNEILYNLKVMAVGATSPLTLMFVLFAGLIYSERSGLPQFLQYMSLALDIIFIGILIFNVIYAHFADKKYSDSKKLELVDRFILKKEEVLKDPAKYTAESIRQYKKALACIPCFVAVSLVLVFFSGIGLGYDESAVTVIILICLLVIFILLFAYILLVVMCDWGVSKELKKWKYTPDLTVSYGQSYNLVKAVFAAEGIDRPLKVEVSDGAHVNVCEIDEVLSVTLGVAALRFLTKEELTAVLCHEMALIRNKDTSFSEIKRKYERKISKLLPLSIYRFICPILPKVHLDSLLAENAVKMVNEDRSDMDVAKSGRGAAFTAAEIKLYGLEFAVSRPFGKIKYQVYRDREWSEEVIKGYFEAISERYSAHTDFYLYSAAHHLEKRMTIHPSLKIRPERFTDSVTDLTLAETCSFSDDINSYFAKESENFKHKGNDIEEYIDKADGYGKWKERYLKGKVYELADLRNLLSGANELDDIETIVSVAENILKKDKEDSVAHYSLGNVYAFEYFSDECISHLEHVALKGEYPINMLAKSELREYACISGNAGLLEKTYSELPEAKSLIPFP